MNVPCTYRNINNFEQKRIRYFDISGMFINKKGGVICFWKINRYFGRIKAESDIVVPRFWICVDNKRILFDGDGMLCVFTFMAFHSALAVIRKGKNNIRGIGMDRDTVKCVADFVSVCFVFRR